MKHLLLLTSTLFITISAFAQTVVNVTDADFGSTDVTWTKDNIYVLTEMIFVKPGTKLTIEPGTVVKGCLLYTSDAADED